MDLGAFKAAVARDRQRVADLDRVAGLLEVFVDSAGVPVTVEAGAERIVVTVDVSGLQGPAAAVALRDVGRWSVPTSVAVPPPVTWVGDPPVDPSFIGVDFSALPDRSVAFTREMQESIDGTDVLGRADRREAAADAAGAPYQPGEVMPGGAGPHVLGLGGHVARETEIPDLEPDRAAKSIPNDPPAPEPVADLRGGPLDDDERAIVQEMLDAGATGKEIGARLNRSPVQLGGVIAAMRRGPRKRVLTPPAAKPVAAAPDPVGDATVPPVPEPVAKVAPDYRGAPPFAGEMSEDARIAARWDDHIATVPETKLFDRAGDLDLMTCLSDGMSAKDFAMTRELTTAEAAGRFLLLMGEAPRTLANQGLCIAALRRAIGSEAA